MEGSFGTLYWSSLHLRAKIHVQAGIWRPWHLAPCEVPLPIMSSASETGFWGTQWKCPENQVATGARLKVATWTPGADNTMVNGVELTCDNRRSARWKVGEK